MTVDPLRDPQSPIWLPTDTPDWYPMTDPRPLSEQVADLRVWGLVRVVAEQGRILDGALRVLCRMNGLPE